MVFELVRFRRKSDGGFALVITLMLMVLLAVLAVGLLGLSAVSVRTSSHGSALSEARSNARLALMLAISQLQRELGPDSRISAAHDAGETPPGGSSHWTAVYDAWTASESADGQPDVPWERDVAFREWLVSGESGAPGDVLMVGPGTLGQNVDPDDEVRVPFQTLPNNGESGRIAWWTSDEGMKAKVNAGPGRRKSSRRKSPIPCSIRSRRQISTKRCFPLSRISNGRERQRELSISTGQLRLAAELGNDAGLGLSFHDLTVHSEGVLADVRAGRLKRDLTQLLSRPIKELEDKPLYVADGRINRFDVSEDGVVSNLPWVGSSGSNNGNEWGINLEELSLFHNIHRQIDWSAKHFQLPYVTKDECRRAFARPLLHLRKARA